MTENTLQIINSLQILVIGLFATLYGFGGISGKWKRRVIGPVVYTTGIIGFSLLKSSFSWWYLLCALLLYAALSIGYGGTNTTIEKIIKRARYGLACALASLPIFVVQQAWTLLALHIYLCVSMSVVAGVWNQTSSARSEETMIGMVIVTIPFFII